MWGFSERRVLATLDEPPPAGYGRWDGTLLARHLGDISKHQIWRVLRRHEISLARRRSWCISTDPCFAQKAADIVGLYLQPPENAVVLSVDGARPRNGSACRCAAHPPDRASRLAQSGPAIC